MNMLRTRSACIALALISLAFSGSARATVLYWFTGETYPVGTTFNHNVNVAADIGSATTQISDGTDVIVGGPNNGLTSNNAQPYAIQIVTAPNPPPGRPGTKAVRFEERALDYKYNGTRAEFQALNAPTGGVYWYAWSVYVPSGSDEFWEEVLGQMHQDNNVAGSPPLGFSRTPFSRNPLSSFMDWQLSQRSDTTTINNYRLSAPTTNTWVDYVVQVNWARDNTGFVNVWQNGIQVLAVNNRQTDYATSVVWPYYKFGIYKWPWSHHPEYTGITPTRVAYYDEIKIGDAAETYASMAPRRNPYTLVPAPTGLTAVGTNGQVGLKWTASSGAVGYNVKRATVSGGPYATSGTNVVTTSYTDANVANGTTYYYVISTVNAAGEGTNSAQISATARAVPIIIFKLDDIYSNTNPRFDQVFNEQVVAKSIKAGFGVIGSNIVPGGATLQNLLIKWNNSGRVELWHHGYTHVSGEFSTATLADQYNSLQLTYNLMLTNTGIALRTFGAPFNATNADTITAMNNLGSLNIWKFASSTTGSRQSILQNRVDVETSAGHPSFSYFQSNYAAKQATYPYMVVQAHPNLWSDAEYIEFSNTVDFLIAQGSTFMTASEYDDQFGGTVSAPPPAPPGCLQAVAGGPWQIAAIGASQTGTFTVTFDATPSVSPFNAVVGLSQGTQTTYTGYACLVGFTTSIVARNGGVYSSASTIPFSGGSTYHFRLDVNVPAHTYSIYVTPPGGTELTVGANYAFRTEQNTVASLDAWGTVVDSTVGSGNLQVCNFLVGAPPPAPTGLTATAVSANQINLSWTASTGAASYNVKRATINGGPYTTIATGVTGTTLSSGGLAASTTYYYVVSAVNAGGESANSSQASATTLSGGGVPAAPTGLTATAGNAQVGLSWTATSGATSYNLKRATVSGGPYTTVATGVTATNYTNTGLTNGTTYYYVVSAVNSVGESPNSLEVNATPLAPPPAPTGLTATAGNAQVALSWSASSGATSYNVKRATVSGGPYTTIASPTTTSYTDTTAVNGTTYYYVVSALNGGGESVNSSEVSATPQAPPSGNTHSGTWSLQTVLPSSASFSNCTDTATVVPNSTYVASVWIKGTGSVRITVIDGHGVTLATLRCDATSTWTQFTTAAFNTGSYTTLYYRLQDQYSTAGTVYLDDAFMGVSGGNNVLPNPGFESGNVSWVISDATIWTIGQFAPPPTQVAAPSFSPGAGTYTTSQSVTITSSTSGATIRYTTDGVTTPTSTVGTVYTGLVTISVTTTLQAIAYKSGMTDSTVTSGTYTINTPPPSPTGLTATAGNAQVALSWSASSGATSYNVKRATVSGGPYTTIASPTTTSYTDTTAVNGTTYYYVVSAVNGGGESVNSSQVSATPLAPPPSPTGLTATAGNAQVALSWSASSGATSYNVKRATVSGGPYTTIASPTTTSYTDSTAVNGTTYYYVVSAVNGGGESVNSSQVSTTPLAPPSGNTHSGMWSLQAVLPSTASFQNITDTASVVSNSTYVASVWIKGTGSVRITVIDGHGVTLATQRCDATSTWTQFTTAPFSTGSYTQLLFRLQDQYSTAGTVYLDDAFMGVSGGNNVLPNPGFESGNVSWSNSSTAIWTIGQF